MIRHIAGWWRPNALDAFKAWRRLDTSESPQTHYDAFRAGIEWNLSSQPTEPSFPQIKVSKEEVIAHLRAQASSIREAPQTNYSEAQRQADWFDAAAEALCR
jgi:hypothetical protein